jgi:hypothetical membrane protein
MGSKNVNWLKISGVCGTIAPIVAFTFISLAITSYPQFSWTDNALSDLGAVEGVTAVLFNSGLIIGGILAIIFASGLFIFLRNRMLGRIGAFIFTLAALVLVAIGIFTENFGRIHYYVSVAFFTFAPISMLIICATFFVMRKVKMGLFTFLTAIIAALVWVLQFAMRYVPNVAIPETISALLASTWSIVLGFQMLKQGSRSNK